MTMTQSTNTDSSNLPTGEPKYTGSRDYRRGMRRMHHTGRYGAGGGAWVGGAVLVLLGTVLLLENAGMFLNANAWALFILIPAAGAFGSAWNLFLRSDEGLSGNCIRSLMTGIVLTGLAFALFFSLDLTYLGPVMLILIGAGGVLSAFLRTSVR
jgi:hypothetical protein